MRPSISILRLALAAGLVAGCAEADLDAELAVESAPLSAAAAANLAYPEYDLNVPVGWYWMHATDVAGIQWRISQGDRLVSIDVVTPSPLTLAGTGSPTSSRGSSARSTTSSRRCAPASRRGGPPS
jgi:hypothetical protein